MRFHSLTGGNPTLVGGGGYKNKEKEQRGVHAISAPPPSQNSPKSVQIQRSGDAKSEDIQLGIPDEVKINH